MTIAPEGRTTESPSVVMLLRSTGFPNGMAATDRVRLLGRALKEQGIDVRVLCVRVSERPGAVLNTEVAGDSEGIPYLYTPGTTVNPTSFLARRYRAIRGYIVALDALRRLRRESRLDCVYLPEVAKATQPHSSGEQSTASNLIGQLPTLWLLRPAIAALKVPIIVELNELPARVTWLPGALAQRISQLAWACGATPISEWLRGWVLREAARLRTGIDVVLIPIVVDPDEQPVTPYPRSNPTLVYSASSAYLRSTAFILRAMRRVWQRHPDCRLVVTGITPEAVATVAGLESVGQELLDGRLTAAGYLHRDKLLALYRDASALLAPLHDDLQSTARFPTKIGEYLVAARPVVTTAIGEIPRFMKDRETAFVAATDDVDAFAGKIIDVLDDADRAEQVGLAGRQLAEEAFDYRLHGPALAALVRRLAAKQPPETP